MTMPKKIAQRVVKTIKEAIRCEDCAVRELCHSSRDFSCDEMLRAAFEALYPQTSESPKFDRDQMAWDYYLAHSVMVPRAYVKVDEFIEYAKENTGSD